MATLTGYQVRNRRMDSLVRQVKTEQSAKERAGKNLIPSDYSELFTHYYEYVVLLVRKAGIPENDSEDVAMTILTTFMERNALEDYDPERIVVRNGVERTAAFRTFLSGFVLLYVRHFRERINTRTYREGLSADTVMYRDEADQEVTLMDLNAPIVDEGYDDLMTEDLVLHIRQHIGEFKPRNGNDRMDLQLFFDIVVEQVREHDEVRPSELAELFDINRSTTFNWLRALRKEIAVVLEARVA